MPRRSRQLRVCDPNLLLQPLADPLAHRHARILWALPVDSSPLYRHSNLDLHHGLLAHLAEQPGEAVLCFKLRYWIEFSGILLQRQSIEFSKGVSGQ
jgi:hypothetical protein